MAGISMLGLALMVLLCFGFYLLIKLLSLQRKSRDSAFETKQEMEQYKLSMAQQVRQMKQRIEVLEKIVTDEGYKVQKEINNL